MHHIPKDNIFIQWFIFSKLTTYESTTSHMPCTFQVPVMHTYLLHHQGQEKSCQQGLMNLCGRTRHAFHLHLQTTSAVPAEWYTLQKTQSYQFQYIWSSYNMGGVLSEWNCIIRNCLCVQLYVAHIQHCFLAQPRFEMVTLSEMLQICKKNGLVKAVMGRVRTLISCCCLHGDRFIPIEGMSRCVASPVVD